MRGFTLSLKISLMFAAVSILTMSFLYYAFYHLFDEYIMKMEMDKAALIAQTIEPAIGMNHYLGMEDEVRRIAEQTLANPELLGISVVLKDELVWTREYDETIEHIHFSYPVKDPVTKETSGNIDLSYSLLNYETTVSDIKSRILYYLAVLAVLFVLVAAAIRYLLKPLRQIARVIGNHSVDSSIDFSSIRVEKETSEIVSAFTHMMDNVREHTVLLERYRHSLDESSIVSKINIDGLITYVNDEFCRVSGYSRNELIDVSMCAVCEPYYSSGSCLETWETIVAGNIWKGTIKNRCKNGSSFYVRSTIVPIKDERNQIIEFISIQNDITRLIEQKEQILRQTTDVVTGMPNRIRLDEDLKSVDNPKMALLNIDNYNIIKDYYGYDIGGKSINKIAALLNDFIEDKDVQAYKMAAGEFALLAGAGVELDFFELICKHLVNKIDDLTISIDDAVFNPRAYCGITSNPDSLLSYSSLALRHAESNGKAVIVYEDTENLVQQYEDNIVWTTKIRDALDDDRIVVYVQPIYNARTNKLEKYESLVRLIEDDGKVISPFFFLDIAKKSRLYSQITRRVVNKTLDIMVDVPGIEFTINLSVEDLTDNDTTAFIKKKITDHGVGHRLVFEIVESEGFESFNEGKQFISDLKKLGCKIAIDDFGTGYSNFAYLLELNVDIIKLDGSLIKAIDQDKNSQIITAAILDFSRQLDIMTVAEFVHSEPVLNYVKNIGVDYVQGFHLGEPVPIESTVEMGPVSVQSA